MLLSSHVALTPSPLLPALSHLQIRLGLLLLTNAGASTREHENFIKKLLKDWDAKGKGQVAKGEFRLHMRKLFADAKESVPSSNECDELFDSWDDDRGGSLDHKELTLALLDCPPKASRGCAGRSRFGLLTVATANPRADLSPVLHRWQARLWKQDKEDNPTLARAQTRRTQARLYDGAAAATADAERFEHELVEFMTELEGRADVRLGYLLRARCIKPGAVVTDWSTSRGEHAGELSKVEFRQA